MSHENISFSTQVCIACLFGGGYGAHTIKMISIHVNVDRAVNIVSSLQPWDPVSTIVQD